MYIVSPGAVVFVLLVLCGLVAAAARGLSPWQRLAAVIVTLAVPLLGGPIVALYVVATRRSRRPG